MAALGSEREFTGGGNGQLLTSPLNGRSVKEFVGLINQPQRNPQLINWTILYRRNHKKGQSEKVQKQRTCCAVKFQKAITGASLADIMAKRNQKTGVRKAQREPAIRAAKEAKRAKQVSKKTAMAAAKFPMKAAPKPETVKPVKVSAS
ncbi:60S ribosomal protein L24-like [Neomonachus schauinslandi]|uniref:60S ribosomal protein L24-like n=1 Tax=Neomonachus schauinslandi TaxID=29088 RepID=A0A8M1MJL4_NEOSC|nr:60S ribosomal protein L24-like [Neomonachus schauinslandi]